MDKLSLAILSLAAFLAFSCGEDPVVPEPAPEQEEKVSCAKGADISWITEMESKGYKFYDASGAEKECTALLKSIGFDAVRYRVWVNPSDGWCGQDDVVVKAKRAQALGMKVMIDFHYGDSWCDPGKQPIPAAWKGHTADQLAADVAGHTRDVLKALKAVGVDVAWVQVGNEVTGGMLWETCRVKDQEASAFVKCFNSGASAVKEVYPDAKVILHANNGWDFDLLKWFYDLMKSAGASYDIIGLSLYPSYWDSASKSYPDWTSKTSKLVSNVQSLHTFYSKEVMLVEFGMPQSEPQASKDALQYLMDKTAGFDWFGGIFLWEPESEPSRNNYSYGAFSGGKPTVALDPFKD